MVDVVQHLHEMDPSDKPEFVELVQASLETLHQAFTMFKPEEVALSFNGGKDCTVVLHLLRAALETIDSGSTEEQLQESTAVEGELLKRVKFVHFVKPNEFEQIEEFRSQIEELYGIRVQLYSADFKREVQRLIEEEGVKAILMGNRRTDPWSQDLQQFTESSEGWPSFMRVFPILDWDYCAVWHFLRSFSLPYCSLYDQGFTSLGEKHNSQPNPKLKCEGEGNDYRPAYELNDGTLERLSRI